MALTGEGTAVVSDFLVGETCNAGDDGGAGGMVQLNPSLNFLVLPTLWPISLSLARHWSSSAAPDATDPSMKIPISN